MKWSPGIGQDKNRKSTACTLWNMMLHHAMHEKKSKCVCVSGACSCLN